MKNHRGHQRFVSWDCEERVDAKFTHGSLEKGLKSVSQGFSKCANEHTLENTDVTPDAGPAFNRIKNNIGDLQAAL